MDYLTTANVLLWVFLTIAFYFVFLSHWLVASSLFPDYVERCQEQYRRPVVTTLVGLLFTVVPIVAGLTLAKIAPPALKWTGILITAVPVITGLLGTAGLARRVGCGMPSPVDENQPWRRVLRGGTALALTFLLPLLGQLVVIPLVVASGVGASALAWLGRKQPAAGTASLPASQ
ncbi:hypothetical protein [Luteolibacter marinus]|uniref:hypothetical protein n=1 Tax=Luteolibacter marinus TaxID=2776705 RepID=UPI001867CB75|nr:hypothetical protein [Luteolibacter marinus]